MKQSLALLLGIAFALGVSGRRAFRDGSKVSTGETLCLGVEITFDADENGAKDPMIRCNGDTPGECAEQKWVEQEDGTHWQCGKNGESCFKEECKKPPPTAAIAGQDDTASPQLLTGNEAATADTVYSKQLVLITDVGEECDDEAAVYLATQIAAAKADLKLDVVFVHGQEAIDNFKSMFDQDKDPSTPNGISFLAGSEQLSQVRKGTGVDEVIILQIGPVNNADIKHVNAAIKELKPYDYFLVGALGATFNSDKDKDKTAQAFVSGANLAHIVKTDRGKGAFKFSMAAVAEFPDGLKEHIERIGFRNTIGRAEPTAASFFTAGLVSDNGKGANYNTAMGIQKELNIEVTDDKDKQIQFVVQKYLADLEDHQTIPKIGVSDHKKPDGCGVAGGVPCTGWVSANGATRQSVVKGYTKILKITTGSRLGLPVDLIVSGKPGKWEPQWRTLGQTQEEVKANEGPLFKPRYTTGTTTTEKFDRQVRESWTKWKAALEETPTTALTPAYDVVGLLAAFDGTYFLDTTKVVESKLKVDVVDSDHWNDLFERIKRKPIDKKMGS